MISRPDWENTLSVQRTLWVVGAPGKDIQLSCGRRKMNPDVVNPKVARYTANWHGGATGPWAVLDREEESKALVEVKEGKTQK
jgi:hypothetical protein